MKPFTALKPLIVLVSALELLFPITSSYARSQSRDVTVQGVFLTPAQWSDAVSRKLDKVLAYTFAMSNKSQASGISSVRFHADGENRPTGLILTRRSGDPMLDMVVMRAINHLGPLPSMPSGFRTDQTFVANVLFAADFGEYMAQIAQLRKEASAMRIASSADPKEVALVITSHAGAGS